MDDVRQVPAPPPTNSPKTQKWLEENREAIAESNAWDDENELFTDPFSPLA